MAASLAIEPYEPSFSDKWDAFVLDKSANGTILQSRRFLSYHPDGRFVDASLIIKKGTELVGVVPAAQVEDNGLRVFSSHPGSTFGGLVVSADFLSAEASTEVALLVDEWIWEHGYDRAVMKLTSRTFSRRESSSLDYALQHAGYKPFGELSFVIDLNDYPHPVEKNFTARRRRDCRYGEKAGCEFSRLSRDDEIARFYEILKASLAKFNAKPVHTLDELLDFKNNRLADECRFYGVFLGSEMIAGSMVFLFGSDVFHTQYLAADPEHLDCFPMNFLDWNLIRIASEEGFSSFSFGISTEEHGKILNTSLARFKDGFGCEHCINWTYEKVQNGLRR